MAPPRFVTADDRALSIWQSAVELHLQKKLAAEGERPSTEEVLSHPMMQATNDHVEAEAEGKPVPPSTGVRSIGEEDYSASASQRAFWKAFPQRMPPEVAEARARGLGDAGPSDSDLGEWAAVFAENSKLLLEGKHPEYIDHHGNMSFGVIPWQLPDDATIIVVGDWGSGSEDAVELLADAIRKAGPRLGAIVHLGDVYYSGQPSECEEKMVKATALAFKSAGVKPVPTFWTPGNHEYYSLGKGFYATFKKLNAGNAQATQQASYFCLRTKSGKWQLLGMDTGQSDHVSAEGAFSLPTPKLRPAEVAWHQDKLRNFGGKTILFSHHQLYSKNAEATHGSESPWVNHSLWSAFNPYFPKVALWLWGHEHNQQLFAPGQFGLARGGLIGASAYEERVGDAGLKALYSMVQLADDYPALGVVDGYFDHGYAIVDLGEAGADATVAFYSFPSWAPKHAPKDRQSALITREVLATPEELGAAGWPSPTNLARYVPLGMAPGHKNRLWISGKAEPGTWNQLDDDAHIAQEISGTALRFRGSRGNDYGLNIEVTRPTAGSSSTCRVSIALHTASGAMTNIQEPLAPIRETTLAEPNDRGLKSTVSISAQGATIDIQSFPSGQPNVTWYPHVLFTIKGASGAMLYIAIEDKDLRG